ncbi:MAG: YIP1 family protein, partial [Clostridia bacterium]|nr:YIP1 family protein [Clostridia bacterium]
EEQLARSESYVPVEFSNLTIDAKGFVYVTCGDIDTYSLYSAIKSRSTESTYAPIKKLNPSGKDVLKRKGFFPPVGEIQFNAYGGSGGSQSNIAEVALLDNNMYVLLDNAHNKLFFYDSSGDLLYAFGGAGDSIGLYTTLASVAFKGDEMFCLDSADLTITVSKKTEYGKLLDKVIGLQEARQYDETKKMWNSIISKNNNFDIAYLGIGKVNLEKGNYKEAMEYFRLIGNKDYYAKAYNLYREEFLAKYGIYIFFAVIAIVLLLIKLFMAISRFNSKRLEEPARGKFGDELLFGFYTIVHPFGGYYALKHEKRGSVRAATVFWVLTGISSVVSTLGACYLQRGDNPSLIGALSNTVFPLLLWCISNMCFTSLMDGKGSFKDVYIAVGYSTVPYVMLMIPCTLISYVLVSDELAILSLVTGLALYWSIGLVLLGMMTVHDYSFGKNIIVTILTIIGIAFILFILLIFFNLIGRVQALIVNVINEISYRS